MELNKLSFTVLGEPVGKQRPRVVRTGKFTRAYTPSKTANYEHLVQKACSSAMKECGCSGWFAKKPIIVRIWAFYKIPNSWSKKKKKAAIDCDLQATVKPDVDNVAKSICDALNGLVYGDDSQIISLSITKFYDDVPRVEVLIGGINEVI